MTETLHRPHVESRERHHLAADAFLVAALIFLAVIGVQESLARLVSRGELGTWTPPVWLELIGSLGMPLAVIGGLLIAWRIYGRRVTWRDVGVAIVGCIVAAVVFGLGFAMVFVLSRAFPNPFPQEGPWALVFFMALAVVVFLAVPIVDAVRDVAGAREHARRNGLRLAMVAVAAVCVVAALFVGGETAELGLFMVLPAFPAGIAAFLIDWWPHRNDEPVDWRVNPDEEPTT
ncbi:MAG: hypothetical protein GX537_07990 [Actinobacteria bacterium]|nr:hypothetical protein [Actinomycetota bacterium]